MIRKSIYPVIVIVIVVVSVSPHFSPPLPVTKVCILFAVSWPPPALPPPTMFFDLDVPTMEEMRRASKWQKRILTLR